MNPRRIHRLMRERFPPVEHSVRNWTVVQDERGPKTDAIASLLAKHVAAPEVVVEVHRKLGALLPAQDAPAYIGAHIGQGESRITDRAFSGFVVVALNGVATGWRHAG